ncbi:MULTISPECIES: hypothetical protein [Bacillus]|uniref:DUF3139 domain-containing protein n=1 Tax=Bacillus glycinifermentans TaxID=1664069 RepID=A0A0T6BNF6_9BACI|nr:MULTISPECIES: hypothetical protein [Bacillus]KRT93102.1 hypothetical protein AB447_203980 [Bacillus glycinifermentans]MEC0341917.1 hypothetical protein [Bacillus sonorensis]MEC0457397.1 hypothetical protein [Bacillus sonorensis]MEC0487913.1 hypothetical protein [Bacillus glycinifermentans]MEC0530808.1 hypothetical protein [Bacillus sonorensis]
MKKICKIVIFIIMLGLSLKGLYSFYQDFFYGNPEKIKQSEEIMRDYLYKEKGYDREDIENIYGFYNYTQAKGKKYAGTVIMNDKKHTMYDYEVHNGKIFELDDIPKKRD